MPFEPTQLRFLCGLAMFNRRCFLGAMHFIESLTAAYCPPRQMAQREPAKLLEQASISFYTPLLRDSASIIPAKQRHVTSPDWPAPCVWPPRIYHAAATHKVAVVSTHPQAQHLKLWLPKSVPFQPGRIANP